MADQAKEATKADESAIGQPVLYVMTDGTTIRPATIVALEPTRAGEQEPRAVLSILTAGKRDRGLIEHHERQGVYEGSGQEPALVVRDGVPFARAPADSGAWPAHSFHFRADRGRVSATAPTERPPAATSETPEKPEGAA